MAISYPINIPNQNFASLSIRLRRANAVSESVFTLQQQVYQYTGARWEAEIRLPPMKRADAKAWEAFIISLRGISGSFLMGNPLWENAAITGATLTNGESVRATTVALSGSGTIEPGDVFSLGAGFDNHLHMAVTGGVLPTTVEIEPPLRTTYSLGASVEFAAPTGVWRLAANDIGWDIDSASTYGFTIPCIEVM